MRDHTKLRAFELAVLCAVLIDYSLNNLSSYQVFREVVPYNLMNVKGETESPF